MFKKPIMIVIISYIIGILWGIYVKNIFLFFVMNLFIIVLMSYMKIRRRYNSKIRLIIGKCCNNICVIFITFSVLGYISLLYKENKFECIYEEKNLEVTIVSNCIEEEYFNKYIARVEKYNINIYILVPKKVKFQYGYVVKLNDELIKPQAQRNTYGFDYKMYLKSINIAGSVNIKNYKIIGRKSNLINGLIFEIKESIRKKIYTIIQSENKYLLEAFLIGNKENISDEINDIFRKSSLSHLIAISGTHITIITTLIFKLFKIIKVGKRTSYYISIIIIYIYMFIAGGMPSVVRSCIGIILVLVSKLIYRKSDIYTNICISAIIILVTNPYNILNLGFVLSYGGIVGIVLYTNIRKNTSKENKIKAYIKEICIISFCVQIIILPIIINSFNNISFTFFISNLMVSPLLFLILNLGIAGIMLSYLYLPLSCLIGKVIDILLQLLLNISKLCANLPFANNICTRIDMPIIIIYYILVIYIVYLIKINRLHIIIHFIKKYILKLVSVFLILVIVINLYNYSGIKELKIYFIDVGQGDATLIKTSRNKVILIDGGEAKEGKEVLLPYLLNRKIKVIDYIIISHFDSDHIGRIILFNGKYESKKYNNR